MCLCTGIDIKGGLEGAPLVQASLATTFGAVGPYFITFALLLFAFTTLLGNLFYCEGCLNYIANRKLGSVPMTVFRLIACGLVFVGAQLSFGLVWDLADVLMGLMALVNLVAILLLGGKAIRVLRDYQKQRRAGKNPVYRYDEVGVGSPEIWNEAHAKKWED